MVTAIRDLIRQRELLPGEPVRQQEMAERLGTSRVPVREALHALQTEGILRHQPNRGYFVAKFSVAQLDQLYLMRQLLETALLERLVWPGAQQLAKIDAVNEKLEHAIAEGQITVVVDLNRQFHDSIFRLSPLETVHREIRRLWEMSDSYRAFYLSGPSRLRVGREHRMMLDALERRDLPALLETLDRHRSTAQEEVATLLGGRLEGALLGPSAPGAA